MADVDLCADCPPVGYPTDKTRCRPCPRRTNPMTDDPKGLVDEIRKDQGNE